VSVQQITDVVLVFVASLLPLVAWALIISESRRARSAGVAAIIYGTALVLCLGLLRGCQ